MSCVECVDKHGKITLVDFGTNGLKCENYARREGNFQIEIKKERKKERKQERVKSRKKERKKE